MKTTTKLICGLFLTAVAILISPKTAAYAYTMDNLEASIENMDFFDNQVGRLNYFRYQGNNFGSSNEKGLVRSYVRRSDPNDYATCWAFQIDMNVDSIFFKPNFTSFQLKIRAYNEEKGWDMTTEDFKLTSQDERICTVDKSGLIKAGTMTGATVISIEYDGGCSFVFVVNQTGKYDKWYEDMFNDVDLCDKRFLPRHMPSAHFANPNSPKKIVEGWGKGWKIITDEYLRLGDLMDTDAVKRARIARDIVHEMCDLYLKDSSDPKAYNGEYGDCEQISACKYQILKLFINTERKNGVKYVSDFDNNHQYLIMALDGEIYDDDNFGLDKRCSIDTWEWSNNILTGKVSEKATEIHTIECYKTDITSEVALAKTALKEGFTVRK